MTRILELVALVPRDLSVGQILMGSIALVRTLPLLFSLPWIPLLAEEPPKLHTAVEG
jgi:hypothetical protein